MRKSISLTSIFASLRIPAGTTHAIIPAIRIVKPTNPAPQLNGFAGGIRRWRGALGTMGDFTLQLPSQGLTRGARLALARQGCATGSFRLNCAESLYAVDAQGRAMFQRIQLDEELEAARFGLMEKPPMRGSDGTSVESGTVIQSLASGIEDRKAARRTASELAGHFRNVSHRTRQRNILASKSMRHSSSGLSSCATFTEGLCNLEDYMRAGDASSGNQTTTSGLSTSFSMQDIGHVLHDLDETCASPILTWFESLKKRSQPISNGANVKKRASTGSLTRSFSCWDLDLTFSGSEIAFTADNRSFMSSTPVTMRRKIQKRRAYTRSLEHLKDNTNSILSTPSTPRHLTRNNSWARLRHRMSKSSSTISKSRERGQNLQGGQVVQGSASVASGLYLIFQQGISMTWGQSPRIQEEALS
ncbi:hypothetical protein DFH11DRAFT_854749 [Phellopilus nigrolimitatus]|nr:hypothetical protein DFH11DRAFT_854749 [Phellopilus nigrolimitatus]